MDPLIGHEAIARELRALADSPEPAHALMFVGPIGTGRTQLARYYALLLNCEGGDAGEPAPASVSMFGDEPAAPTERPCGKCRPCRLILANNHPDIIELKPGDTLCKPRPGEASHSAHPDSRDIRICQVRGLSELCGRFPLEAHYRAVIIEPADRLGRDAAHAILKTLEEPPGHTVLLLVTAAPEDIIETIRSRCRQITVGLVSRQEIEAGLVARGVDSAVAERAAAESRGRTARAFAFAARPDTMEDRQRLLDRCAELAAQPYTPRFKYSEDLAERWRRDRSLVHNELDAWEAFWQERLHRVAAAGDANAARDAAAALAAVTTAREDLLANVLPRAALDLMLLHFPRVTLEVTPGEEPVPTHV